MCGLLFFSSRRYLKNYNEAIRCCQRNVELLYELDRSACFESITKLRDHMANGNYNLANVLCDVGVPLLLDTSTTAVGMDTIKDAISYYQRALLIYVELGNRESMFFHVALHSLILKNFNIKLAQCLLCVPTLCMHLLYM